LAPTQAATASGHPAGLLRDEPKGAGLEQPAPDVTHDDVVRILRRDFAPGEIRRAEALLRDSDPALSPRVALAILKLSDGDLDAVRGNIEAASRDWRDVIAYAEYPAYMSKVPGTGALRSDQRNQIIRSDWEQYRSWLDR
jgi:hypothetical protein